MLCKDVQGGFSGYLYRMQQRVYVDSCAKLLQ